VKAAVVLMAYGSPERLADVPAYYADIRGGRPIAPELLDDLVARYRALGIGDGDVLTRVGSRESCLQTIVAWRDVAELEPAVRPRRSLVGLQTQPGDIPRHGGAVSRDGRRAGVITSGTHSFFLGHPIALALLEGPSLRVGEKVTIEVRGREAPAEVVKLPFYRGSARSAVAPAKS